MDIKYDFIRQSLIENRFWLEILRDHSVFVTITLDPKEKDFLNKAMEFIQIFTQRLDQIQQLMENLPDQQTMAKVNDDNYKLGLEFRNYQQCMLDRQLICQLGINMTPTFLEHMIREDEEYLRVLWFLQQGVLQLPAAAESLHQHTLWLPDAAGHAASIAASLDMTETPLIKKATKFEKSFKDLFFKNYELKNMLSPCPAMIPVLQKFNYDSAKTIKEFVCYLSHIMDLVEKCQVLSQLIPLMPDHMIREEHYYLAKLKEAGTKIE